MSVIASLNINVNAHTRDAVSGINNVMQSAASLRREAAKISEMAMTDYDKLLAAEAKLGQHLVNNRISGDAYEVVLAKLRDEYEKTTPVAKALAEAEARRNQQQQEATKIIERNRSPYQRLLAQQTKLNELQAAGVLTGQHYRTEWKNIQAEFIKAQAELSGVAEKTRQAKREQEEWVKTGEQIRRGLMTPFDHYREKIAQLSEALRRGVIDQKTFTAAVHQAGQAYKQAAGQAQGLMARLGMGSGRDVASQVLGGLGVGAGIYGAIDMGRRSLMHMIDTGKEFEYQINRAGVIARASREEFRAMEAEAMRLGATTEHSSSDAAEGMEQMAMAGLRVNEIIAATGPALALATVGQMSIAESADVSVRMMKAFRLEANRLGDVTDIMAYAVTNSATDMRDLTDALKYAAPAAATAGYDFIQTAAAVMTVSNNLRGEMAGTAIRGVINQLSSLSAQGRKRLKEFDISVKDTAGNFRQLPEIVDQFVEKLAHLGTADRTGVLTEIFGARAGSGMQVLMNAGGDEIRRHIEGLENSRGLAEQIRKELMDNLKGDLEQLTSSLEELELQIYKFGSGEFLRDMTQGLTSAVSLTASLVDSFNDLDSILGGAVSGAAVESTITTLLGPLNIFRASGKVLGTRYTEAAEAGGDLGKIEFDKPRQSLEELNQELKEVQDALKAAHEAAMHSGWTQDANWLDGMIQKEREIKDALAMANNELANEQNASIQEEMLKFTEKLDEAKNKLLLTERDLYEQEIERNEVLDDSSRKSLLMQFDELKMLEQRQQVTQQLTNLENAYWSQRLGQEEMLLRNLTNMGATQDQLREAQYLMDQTKQARELQQALDDEARQWEQTKNAAQKALEALESPLDKYVKKLQELHAWQTKGLVGGTDLEQLLERETEAYLNSLNRQRDEWQPAQAIDANTSAGYARMIEARYAAQNQKLSRDLEQRQTKAQERLVQLMTRNNQLTEKQMRQVIANF